MIAITTLAKIREELPCSDGWIKLLRHLGKTGADDEPLPLSVVLESNGLEDALWCLRACDEIEREVRLYAVWCVRQVQHLNSDPRIATCLDIAERYAHGQATDTELTAVKVAARTAWATARDTATASIANAAIYTATMFVPVFIVAVWAADAGDIRSAVRAAQTTEFQRVFCSS